MTMTGMSSLAMALMLALVPSTPAQAKGRWLANRDDVVVVLTTEVAISLKSCEGEPGQAHIAMAIDYDGKVRFGCWIMRDAHVLIDWRDTAKDSVFHMCEFAPVKGEPCPRKG